jgi:3-oxoacyl-(acyl-carrier-protein) synthase
VSRAVVVTGLGTLGACGCGAGALQRALAAGVARTTEVDRAAGLHRPGGVRRAALATGLCLGEWLSPGEARRMSPPSKFAVVAARMALRCAGLAPDDAGGEDATAVVVATAFGPASFSLSLLRQVFSEGPQAASPYLFTESVANAPAAQIAIATRARGASVTVCQREAGPLLALGQGAAAVAAGRARRALVGAVEEMIPLLHALLDRFGALARDEVARPFDRRRSGFLAGEGATVLTLESAEEARRRGARVLARVLAWGSAFDPSAPPTGWGSGHAALARALVRGLGRSGIGRDGIGSIDRIVSGASGSRGGDRLEALWLRAAWDGAPLPPVLAPKSVTGEYGGGQLAAAVLAAAGAACGPTAGFAAPDPALQVVPHDGAPLPPPSTVLATAVAAGGAAAWVVLGAP